MPEVHVIKRKGQKQLYDERKVYASVYSACLNAHIQKMEAEKMAEQVAREITRWMTYEREVISSDHIFKKVIELMKEQNKDAAFMYETHRDLS